MAVRTHTYGFLPAGFVRERASRTHGAVLLTMFYGEPRRPAAAPAGFDPRLLVDT